MPSSHGNKHTTRRSTTAQFTGDWILRYHPKTKKSEIVAHAPLTMQCLPTGQIDPDRLVFYAGTADGLKVREPQFLAYDFQNRKVLAAREAGPARAMIFSKTTGALYFHTEKSGAAALIKFHPDTPTEFAPIAAEVGLRCASKESSDGIVYTVDRNEMWAFDTKSETAKSLGETAVATKDYITSFDLCPKTERFL